MVVGLDPIRGKNLSLTTPHRFQCRLRQWGRLYKPLSRDHGFDDGSTALRSGQRHQMGSAASLEIEFHQPSLDCLSGFEPVEPRKLTASFIHLAV